MIPASFRLKNRRRAALLACYDPRQRFLVCGSAVLQLSANAFSKIVDCGCAAAGDLEADKNSSRAALADLLLTGELMRFLNPQEKKTWKDGLILVLAVTIGLLAISYRKSLGSPEDLIHWLFGR
jgi:hypothetical protein